MSKCQKVNPKIINMVQCPQTLTTLTKSFSYLSKNVLYQMCHLGLLGDNAMKCVHFFI